MDVHTKSQRSYNMSRIRSKDTLPEKKLSKLLWKAGYRYRKHYRIVGKPDLVIVSKKIAIFVDGEFWHGKNFRKWKGNLSNFWLNKVSENIKRDKRNDRYLIKAGWMVIHVWGRQIIKDGERVLRRIDKLVLKIS